MRGVSEEPFKHETVVVPKGDLSTTDLLKRAVEGARELVKVEIELAKNEVRTELADVKRAGIALGAAVTLAIVGLSTLVTAVVIAFGTTAIAAVIIGVALLAIAGAVGYFGYRKVPMKPMRETRRRVEQDVQQLKERIA